MSQPPDRPTTRPDHELSGTQVARLGLSNAAAATADRLFPLVSTVHDKHRTPGALTREAHDALKTMNKVLYRAVLYDLLNGAPTEVLHDILRVDPDTLLTQFGKLDIDDVADDPHAMWAMLRPTCPAQINDTCADDPHDALQHLDEWMVRHLDPREAVPAPARPVSAGL